MSAIFTEKPPFNRLNLFINQIKNDPPLHVRMNLSGCSEIHRKMESICYVRWLNEKLILNYFCLKTGYCRNISEVLWASATCSLRQRTQLVWKACQKLVFVPPWFFQCLHPRVNMMNVYFSFLLFSLWKKINYAHVIWKFYFPCKKLNNLTCLAAVLATDNL